jgi:hypothetical protein
MEKFEEFDKSDTDVAIVSLAGRFPGAATADEYWHNIENGIESITFFTETDLVEAGLSLAEIRDPNYVRARRRWRGPTCLTPSFSESTLARPRFSTRNSAFSLSAHGRPWKAPAMILIGFLAGSACSAAAV